MEGTAVARRQQAMPGCPSQPLLGRLCSKRPPASCYLPTSSPNLAVPRHLPKHKSQPNNPVHSKVLRRFWGAGPLSHLQASWAIRRAPGQSLQSCSLCGCPAVYLWTFGVLRTQPHQ